MDPDHKQKNVSSSGTDIDEVKRQNANSGLSYNQAKALLAKQTAEREKAQNDFVHEVGKENL
ncbi:gamma-type small acid-soluble spore protein [Halobacillus sp. K22]|uniref:gamma-type small acid-soluble spore protein n=1 Tax=Halobacillus sp. K22 TaxID=3457431 RepID=UPI003FCEC4E6